jgi:hypothetical protein
LVLDSTPELDCKSQNGYFAGGNGDFSVIPDRSRTYFYFLISTYSGPVSAQGVAVARLAFKDRDNPVGKVSKLQRRVERARSGRQHKSDLPDARGLETEGRRQLLGPVDSLEHLPP